MCPTMAGRVIPKEKGDAFIRKMEETFETG
jgi:hypothetical protein